MPFFPLSLSLSLLLCITKTNAIHAITLKRHKYQSKKKDVKKSMRAFKCLCAISLLLLLDLLFHFMFCFAYFGFFYEQWKRNTFLYWVLSYSYKLSLSLSLDLENSSFTFRLRDSCLFLLSQQNIPAATAAIHLNSVYSLANFVLSSCNICRRRLI